MNDNAVNHPKYYQGKIEVIDIARGLAIGILTYTGHNDIGGSCGTYG